MNASEPVCLLLAGGRPGGAALGEDAPRLSDGPSAATVRVARLGLWEYDPAAGVTHLDDRCRELFGLRPDELPAPTERVLALVQPDDRPRVREQIRAALAGLDGPPFEFEYRVVRPDGTARHVLARGHAVAAGTGPARRLDRLVGMALDVTDQRAAEDRARDGEALLRLAMTAARMFSWECDLAAETIRWSANAAEVLGCDPAALPETMAGSLFFVDPADKERLWRAYGESRAGGRDDYRWDFGGRGPGGAPARWRAQGRVVRDAAGAPARILGVTQDVTAQAAAEDALREREEWFRGLTEASPVGTFRADVGGQVGYVNPGVAAVWGRPAGELLGLGWVEGVHPDDAGPLLAGWAAASAAGRPYEHVYRVVRPGGEVRWVHGRSAVVRRADGRPAGTVGTVDDVTDRRALEDRLRQAAKLEAVGRLAAGVAHNFNNMLTAAIGFADLAIGRLAPDDPARPLVAESLRAAERAAGLTGQLLAYSRQQVLAPRSVDLNMLVSSALTLVRQLAGEGVAVVADLGDGVWPAWADPAQVEQVLVNLAINARDAMPGGGRLTIATRNAKDGFVELDVADTGTGIPADVLPFIFDPFFTTKGLARGTGLGLATVHGVVAQSGGRVEVESASGVGAVFRVGLPRAAAAAPAGTPAPEPPAPPESGTVMVVDDEEVVRTLMAGVLESAGYRVLAAGGGAEAVGLAGAEIGPIRLLVTDVVMPGWTGPRVADALRAARPGLAVLFMSRHTDDEAFRHGVAGRPARFLPKPFTPAQLLASVREELAAGTDRPAG